MLRFLCLPPRPNEHSRPLATWLVAALISLCAGAAFAQPGPGSKHALLIGNAQYAQSPLRNPENDARDLGEALRGLGFEVTVLLNATRAQMLEATARFARRLDRNALSLVYFGGHGVQVGGRNFVLPILPANALKSGDDLATQAVSLEVMMAPLASARPRFNLVVLDACRDNPFGDGRQRGGLAPLDAPPNTLVAFATSPGKVAFDGEGRNGTYTAHLLRHIGKRELRIEEVFKLVRAGVLEESRGRQLPWENTALVGELAESWSQPDPKTWRFKLRDGVKFHSGTVFDAEAAAFGVNWTFSKENNFPIRSNVGPEFQAKAVDKLTLDVVSDSPDPILPSRLYFAPLPDPAQIKNDAASLPIKPIGTGPYKFVEWVKGQRIRMTVNPDWWGHGKKDALGAATIQDVELVFRGETAVRASMLQSGEADFARFLTPDLMASVPRAVKGPSLETVFLRLDTMYPPMADIRVRKAIALAIDKQAVADKIFGGAARPASQLVASVVTGYNPDLQPYPYDMNAAKQLVQEAKAAGVPVDMVITSATRRGVYARHDEFSEYTANQLNAVGLKAKSEVMDPGVHQPQFTNGGYDKTPKDRGWIANNPHSNEIMDVSRSMGYYRCTGSSSTFCDPEMDKLIDAAIPLTGDERAKALAAITKKFYDTYAAIPVVHLDLIHGTSKRLQWESRIDGFLMLKEMSLAG